MCVQETEAVALASKLDDRAWALEQLLGPTISPEGASNRLKSEEARALTEHLYTADRWEMQPVGKGGPAAERLLFGKVMIVLRLLWFCAVKWQLVQPGVGPTPCGSSLSGYAPFELPAMNSHRCIVRHGPAFNICMNPELSFACCTCIVRHCPLPAACRYLYAEGMKLVKRYEEEEAELADKLKVGRG